MKRKEVKVGSTYAVKVSGRVQPVRIDRDRGTRFKVRLGMLEHTGREVHDGYDGTNLATGRAVRIHSAAKIRHEMNRTESAKPEGGKVKKFQMFHE